MKMRTGPTFETKVGPVLIFIAAFLLAYNTTAFAETIELKNGEIIVGEIKHKTEEAVVVSKEGGSFIYSIARDRIKNIRESTPRELKRYEARQGVPAPAAKGEKKEDTRREELKKYRLEKYEKEVQAAKKARGRIKIKFSEDRFGVVNAVLNGKVTASLYVDTGASMVLISGEIAKKLGINLDEEGDKVRVVLADGSTATATAITLKSVEVGPSKIRDVPAAVSKTPPGGGIDGLLGMSFLRYFHVKVDAKENCLVLERY